MQEILITLLDDEGETGLVSGIGKREYRNPRICDLICDCLVRYWGMHELFISALRSKYEMTKEFVSN